MQSHPHRHLKSTHPDVPYDPIRKQLQGSIAFADGASPDSTRSNGADGGGVPVQWVFDRLWYAQELYFDHLLGTEHAEQYADPTFHVNTQDVVRLFSNPSGKPDGSALYGMIFHRLGAAVEMFGAQDEAYYAPEHGRIKVLNVTVQGLHHHTVTVPSLAFADGTFMQGTVRNVFDLVEGVDTRLQSPAVTHYKGNVLSDAYLALWKLSTEFYSAHIFDSACGNFASNLTARFQDCQGSVQNKKISGRDIALLQKKLFGGVAMSQAFYEWATVPGSTLDQLIAKPADTLVRRQQRHYITCGHDGMFHPNKGAVGIRIEFVADVMLENVQVLDVDNTANAGHWLCGETYR
jgi:hypothetical protein